MEKEEKKNIDRNNPIEEPFREAVAQFIEVASVINWAKFLIIISAIVSMVSLHKLKFSC